MKRITFALLIIVMIIGAMNSTAFATGITLVDRTLLKQEALSNTVSDKEIETLKEEMSARNISGAGFNADILYDTNDAARFLLATTSNGYLIFDRVTDETWECGGQNPYERYMQLRKYYGGPMEYYSESLNTKSASNKEVKFHNILMDSDFQTVPESQFYPNRLSEYIHYPTKGTATAQRLPNSYNYIKRRAFGYNNDDTCTAVAFGLALNYLYLQYGLKVVPKVCEFLNNGMPSSEKHMAELYPNTNTLHTKLRTSGMGAVSIGYTIVVNALKNSYFPKVTPLSQIPTVTARLLPAFSKIKENIDAKKPVVITTIASKIFRSHSMVVYGYLETSGSKELLVHTGWYDTTYLKRVATSNDKQFFHDDLWINSSLAKYGYYFTLPNE